MAESIVSSQSKNSKVFKLDMSNESLKQSLLDGGVDKRTDYKDFMKMKFKLDHDSVSGQTILRNFGSKRRSSGNFRTLCRKLNIKLNHFARARADFSDPNVIRRVLSESKVRFSSMKFSKFNRAKISSDLFEGDGKGLLLKYELAKAKKEGQMKKAKMIEKRAHSTKTAFVRMLEEIGAANKYYSSFLENRKLLRSMLLSSRFDFERKPFFLSEFLKMRFKCTALIRKGRGTITGQGLLLKCFGLKNAMRMDNIQIILKRAGFDTSGMQLVQKRVRSQQISLDDPANVGLIRGILDSCKEKVDWSSVKFSEFKFLHFNFQKFHGQGYTLLKRLGGPTSTIMRKVLSIAGYSNSVPKKWEKRLKRINEVKKI